VYGLATCLQGHLWERCGTIRPAGIAKDFAATERERRTLRDAPVIAISDYVKTQMARAGYDPARIHVLRNPAPAPRAYAVPEREGVPRFLFLGRLAIHKGLQWLLRSVAKVGREIAVDVAGEGPQRAEMEALAKSLGLSDSVVFHGWVDEARIDALAAGSRAVVFPAVWHEPAGLSTFDASARGRAVIASRTGGIPEFALEGQNAILVAPNDDDALAGAIRRLVDDPELAGRLGEEGHALASGSFSLAKHIADLDAVYASIGRGSGP
jgi:glycosyltransferase involved in cell wall biosynthesis